jgi:hypothetical protein
VHELLGFLGENALDLIWGLMEIFSAWFDGPSTTQSVTYVRPPGT